MKAFASLTNKHPLLSVCLGALFCVALLFAADWDASESHAVRVQINTRSST